MKTGLIEPHYLPSLEYFCALLPMDRIALETNEHFVKQSDRNRSRINTAHGVSTLVVPLTAKRGKVLFKDVRIDYATRWQNNHWRAIRSAYAKSPFFEHYAIDLEKLIRRDFVFISDLDREVLSFCLRNLGLQKDLIETAEYQREADSGVTDLRSVLNWRKPFADRPFYRPKPYYQVFGSGFASNLSVIDLMFCEGPNALSVLRNSRLAI